MKLLKKLVAVFCIFALVCTAPVYAAEDNHLKQLPVSAQSMFFDLVFSDVVQMYQFDVEENEIYQRMIQNMLAENPEMLDSFFKALFDSFDDYSEFYTAEEFDDFMNSLEGVIGGVGVYLEKDNKYVKITSLVPDGPASNAGIQAGDLLLAVDGVNMEGKSIDFAGNHLRGEVGTNVLVSILRDGETFEFVLTRAELTNSTISYGTLDKDTGYLAIHSFASNTAAEVREALIKFDSVGVKKFVLDLRDNGGGYIDSAIEIAREFVPQGTIITHYTKANGQSMDYKSYLKKPKYSIVTLVNEHTASAAEILASALQDSGVSKLVGEKTYGKAVTQSVFTLYADRACKLTTGEYFTRNGNRINKVGIKPDVDVNNRTAYIKNTNMEKLIYCSAYLPGTTEAGISGFKLRLSCLNYDVGEINNDYTETFKNAVYAYQNEHQIKATGELDIVTQIHITNTTDELEIYVDNQLNEAAKMIGSSYQGVQIVE